MSWSKAPFRVLINYPEIWSCVDFKRVRVHTLLKLISAVLLSPSRSRATGMQAFILGAVAFAVSAYALNSESSLQHSWLQQITGVSHIESGGPISYDYTQGRATNYAYNQAGACGYGPIFPDESLGDPLSILAIPDCSPLFPGKRTPDLALTPIVTR